MFKKTKHFLTDEDGAVTADWVVLTALAVTLLSAGYGMMEQGTEDLASDTSDYMNSWNF